ncbi:MAG: type I DNA topoisomerase [Microbacteriaceae bacterium]
MPDKKTLVIVESPAKARTIAQYLGDDYDVRASVGHIRDLIDTKKLPPELKKQGTIGRFSVDVDNDFEPYYGISEGKTKTVSELKSALKNADELILATDEDREGEAIAWHLLEVLNPKIPVKRMVFHEITKDAIEAAKANTRDLDTALVDAQETRRIMDRIFGFEVSPVLWRKIGKSARSAGRVQSPAVRLIVERELERTAFVPASYWDLKAQLVAERSQAFTATLVRLGGNRIASGRDFADDGRLTSKATVLDENAARSMAAELGAAGSAMTVSNVESKPGTRRPAVPFTTSTLQQEAGRKLRLSSKDTMSAAQALYENGYITYMRTDSVALSQQAIDAARAQAVSLYGADSIPDQPRIYASKAKNAQEAHEAIRPSGDTFRTPAQLTGELRGDQWKLYELIWKRTVASQMIDAKVSTTTITASASVDGKLAEFTASGTVILVRGFLQAYEEGKDESQLGDDADATLPGVSVGDPLAVDSVEPSGHETTPPPRYTEASLIKKLEELGIGRPSTYASTISTIINRGYVAKVGQALVPEWVAFPVVRLLERQFGKFVDYQYTAELEEDLDAIANGRTDRVQWLRAFYFGDENHPGLRMVADDIQDIDPRELSTLRVSDTITVRVGQYGPYLEVQEVGAEAPRRVNIPEGLLPDQLTAEKAQELIDAPVVTDRVIGVDPATGLTILGKDGRYGPYVTEELPETGEEVPVTSKKKAAAAKPRTASLFKDMDLAEIDLDTALRLLSLPREVGTDPESGEAITAQNGRFGPYLKKGTDSRSLDSEAQIFDIDLAGALAIYAQPKYGGRSAAAALREFDADPVSGKPIKVKDGRFGPYVTDGATNATIPKTDTVEGMTFERAVELLQIKRDKGPVGKPVRKTATTTKRKAATKK